MNWINALPIAWLLFCWVGYTYFAKYMAKRSHSLSSVLQVFRVHWMEGMIRRDMRMPDAALLANIERNVSFFASTTILVLAGLLTVLINTEGVLQALSGLPFLVPMTALELHLKLLILIGIFVHAFFTFTWSMRQFGFASVLLGAAPVAAGEGELPKELVQYARHAAKVIDQASHSYNYGLRAYYFSLSMLAWFINAWLFLAAVTLVVAVLYHREFHSKPLLTMAQVPWLAQQEKPGTPAK